MVAEAGPEIVVGVVTPVGTDTTSLVSSIRGELARWNYAVSTLKLSEYFESADPQTLEHEDDRIKRLIAAGNKFCEDAQHHGAIGALAIREIRIIRALANQPDVDITEAVESASETPLSRHAYILHSLKRPAEVKLLRAVYGNHFYLIGSQASLEHRLQTLAARLNTHTGWSEEQKQQQARELIDLDASEEHEYGQGVGKTFPQADYFISEGENPERAVSLLFGDHRIAPRAGEHAMFMAYGSSARSLVGSRRVGASIVDTEGTLVCVGANEVPQQEQTDAALQHDMSEREKRGLLADTLKRLADNGHLSGAISERLKGDVEQTLDELMDDIEGSELLNVIEFQRPVHAEMDAITVAARSGRSIAGCSMYATTYPCHLCAKHILATGITSIHYIEPYPKSKAATMYAATSSKVRPYHGVNPGSYVWLFLDRELPRPDARGRIPAPKMDTAQPLVPDDDYGRVVQGEADALSILSN